MVAHRVGIAAHRQLEPRLVRNNIVLRARVKTADRHHRAVERAHLARHQGLERADDPAPEHDRVLRRLRIGAVSADALHQYVDAVRSEEHTSELQSLMRISYAVFCLKKTNTNHNRSNHKT